MEGNPRSNSRFTHIINKECRHYMRRICTKTSFFYYITADVHLSTNVLYLARYLLTKLPFMRNRMLNFYNTHQWGEENPHAILQSRKHNFKVILCRRQSHRTIFSWSERWGLCVIPPKPTTWLSWRRSISYWSFHFVSAWLWATSLQSIELSGKSYMWDFHTNG